MDSSNSERIHDCTKVVEISCQLNNKPKNDAKCGMDSE